MSMIINPSRVLVDDSSFSFEQVRLALSDANSASYGITLSADDVGPQTVNKRFIVIAATYNNSSNHTQSISGFSGGTLWDTYTATGGSNLNVKCFLYEYNSASSVSFQINTTATVQNCHIAVWRVTGCTANAFVEQVTATAGFLASSVSVAVDTPANGGAALFWFLPGITSITPAWTNATEDAASNSAEVMCRVASRIVTTAETGTTVSFAPTSGQVTQSRLTGVSLGP